MTYREAYLEGRNKLQYMGMRQAGFETIQLFSFCTGMARQELLFTGDARMPKEQKDRFLKLVEARRKGKPLQYLLGEWEFMGRNFFVSEGALIPREDTAVLVEKCMEFFPKDASPHILELCAGSGIISVSLGLSFPCSEILSVELSPSALSLLKKNLERYDVRHAVVRQDNVLKPEEEYSSCGFDLLVCNPPYIPRGDLPFLQKEVQFEPSMALDGGIDGLDFYRAIIKHWLWTIKPGGFLAVEVGIHQADDVGELFLKAGLDRIEMTKDINGINRVVSGMIK